MRCLAHTTQTNSTRPQHIHIYKHMSTENNIHRKVKSDGHWVDHTLDAQGNLLRTDTRDGRWAVYGRDEFGRLTDYSDSEGLQTSRTYGENGEVATLTTNSLTHYPSR